MKKIIYKINQLTIRTKLVVLNSFAFALISVFLFLFIPPGIERYLMEVLHNKEKSIAAMISSSIGPALYFGDVEEGTYVLNSVKLIPDIVYVVVLDNDGNEYISYNLKEAIRYNYPNSILTKYLVSGDILKTKKAVVENKKVIGHIYLGMSLKSVENTISAARILITLSSAIIFIFFFLATYGISRVVMAPLVKIVGTIEKISGGDRNLRAEISSQKEVYQLAVSFNQMLDNLNSTYEDLQKSNDLLETRVIERTDVLRKLNESLQNEITVREKAEKITEALYTISKAQNSTQKLDKLFEIIYQSIGIVLNNKNFFIAQYDKDKDVITFPYFKDEFDEPVAIENASFTNSLTVEVIQKGKSLLFQQDQLKEIWEWDQQKKMGTLAKVWMGIPLKIKEDTIGAMVMQSYDNPDQFTVSDIEIAESFAEQIAVAINSKKTEERITLLLQAIESTGEFVMITDNSSNLIYANKAFYDTYGYSNVNLRIRDIKVLAPDRESEEIINEIFTLSFKEGWQGELVLLRKDKTQLPILLSTSPVLNENNEPVALIAVGTDLTEIKQAHQVIQESEEKFKYLFEHNPLPMYVRDQFTAKFIEVNDAMVRHYGYSKEEFLSMDLTDIYVGENVFSYIEKIKMASIGDQYSIQGKHRLKNGSLIDIEFTTHIINYSGKTAVLAVVVDVTSRLKVQAQLKTSLLEKETLLKEIHHRVKNNLQVISSLLNLQSKKIKDNYDLALFNESQDRVRSMAMIHEMLYRSKDLDKIDFADYLKKLISSLMRSYNFKRNVSLKMEVKDIYLNIDKAVPCGLIINELVTNSLKYAFPDSRAGYISVHAEQNGSIKIIVEDNGIGLPESFSFEKIDSLGLKLVKILTDQLQGNLEVIRNDGTKFVINLK